MGRRAVSSFDDVLLQKCRGVLQKVLDNVNGDGELEHVESLYASNTLATLNERAVADGSTHKPPYTFEHFVEHLDVEDSTFHNLMELLVTLTARKAIAKAAQQKDEELIARTQQQREVLRSASASASAAAASSSSTSLDQSASFVSLAALRFDARLGRATARTSRECQREMMRNRALQGEIRGITRRNRRSRRGVDDSDSSSSEGVNVRSPPPTRTVFSSLLDPTSFPSLQGAMANGASDADGATTRAARVGQGSTTYHWLQRDLSSIRRRSGRGRDEQGHRSNIEANVQPTTSDVRSSSPTRNNGSGGGASNDVYGFYVASSNETQQQNRGAGYDSLVRQFLSQSFPSDARRISEAEAETAHSSTQPTALTHAQSPEHSFATSLSSLSASASGPSSQLGIQSTLAPTMLHSSVERTASTPSNPLLPLLSVEHAHEANVVESPRNTDDGGSGTQARLDAVHAALHRLSASRSNTSLRSSTPPHLPRRSIADRTGEFEAFAARRRHDQRVREQQRRTSVSGGERDQSEEDQTTLERVLSDLSRADETLDQILGAEQQEAHSMRNEDNGDSNNDDIDGAAEPALESARIDPLAERLVPSFARPVARIPSSTRLRAASMQRGARNHEASL